MLRRGLLLTHLLVVNVWGQQSVDSATFNDIIHYHSFAAATYADDCPTPPWNSVIVKQINEASTDTQATLYYDSQKNEVIMSFRGSSTPTDFINDFDFLATAASINGFTCSGCNVHEGFQRCYNSISQDVASSIADALASHPSSSLVLTGHSLGGALASLGSATLVSTYPSLRIYTYGEPRNGNTAFSTYIDSKIPNYVRVTHYNDGVPTIPPSILGYTHHGTEYWLSAKDSNTVDTTKKCPGSEPLFCVAAQLNGPDGWINGAHIAYAGLTANSLYNPGCGFVEPS